MFFFVAIFVVLRHLLFFCHIIGNLWFINTFSLLSLKKHFLWIISYSFLFFWGIEILSVFRFLKSISSTVKFAKIYWNVLRNQGTGMDLKKGTNAQVVSFQGTSTVPLPLLPTCQYYSVRIWAAQSLIFPLKFHWAICCRSQWHHVIVLLSSFYLFLHL